MVYLIVYKLTMAQQSMVSLWNKLCSKKEGREIILEIY